MATLDDINNARRQMLVQRGQNSGGNSASAFTSGHQHSALQNQHQYQQQPQFNQQQQQQQQQLQYGTDKDSTGFGPSFGSQTPLISPSSPPPQAASASAYSDGSDAARSYGAASDYYSRDRNARSPNPSSTVTSPQMAALASQPHVIDPQSQQGQAIIQKYRQQQQQLQQYHTIQQQHYMGGSVRSDDFGSSNNRAELSPSPPPRVYQQNVPSYYPPPNLVGTSGQQQFSGTAIDSAIESAGRGGVNGSGTRGQLLPNTKSERSGGGGGGSGSKYPGDNLGSFGANGGGGEGKGKGPYDDDDDDDDEEREDSPFFEVRAAVSNRDNPMLPSLTFRVWVLGIFFCIVLSALNQFLWFRANPISITILVVQILAFPLAKFMEWLLPRTVYSTAGLEWTFNPGPFTIKEHVLISIFANAGVASAYAIDIVVVKKVYFGTDIGFTGSLLLVFSSQMIGYGLAGVCRQYLVYPAAMIWPANLANIVLFRTFHESSNWTGWSRTRMFWTCFIGSFLWYWLPGYLFTMLSFFSVLCFFNRDSVLLAQLGDGQKGMAVLALTFDWSNISSTFLFSPIVTPFWAALNVFVGFVLVMWILTPIGYYLNVWDAKKYPIYSYDVYDIDGHVYNVTRVLDSNHNLNVTEYYKYSPLRMSYEFSFTYGLGFAGFTCILSYIYLHYGEEIWLRFRASKRLPDDIHMKLMRVYPEVPQWWYLALFVLFFALGVIACIRYDLQVKWYIFLLALAMALLCTIPIGIIQAVTNQQLGTNILSELVYGYIYPGMPIGNVTFKTFAYITTVQGLLLVQDLKLGHYMKIPPRHMFICQTIGTLIAALVQLGLTYIMIDGMPDLCKDTPDNMWNCSQAATFFSASLIFGLASPKRVYNDQDYALNLHGFWVGVLLPIPFYYLARRYPDSWVAHIHIPVILSSSGWLPPSPPVDYSAWFLVNLFFNFYVKRYRTAFWERFAFAISAGLDAGLAVSTVLIFVALTNNGYNIEWWGTQRVCRNAGVATNGPEQK